MMHSQILYDKGLENDGWSIVSGFSSRIDCAKAAGKQAALTGMKPPRKWMFWRIQWPDDVLEYYHEQLTAGNE